FIKAATPPQPHTYYCYSYTDLVHRGHYSRMFPARVRAVASGSIAVFCFELTTHKKPTFSDLYLIHQQGTQGAEEHVNHPDRIAWQSMCATNEGKQKGEKWCKRAIWENTLPEVKHLWKSVENLTSGIFLNMWQNQVDHFYARYSGATKAETSNCDHA